MKSFSFSEKEITPEILSLFKELLVDGTTCDCCYEVLTSALRGRIDLASEFNLKGYEFTVKGNEKLVSSKESKRFVYLDDKHGDSLESSFECMQVQDRFSGVGLEMDYKWAVQYILDSKSWLIVQYGIDIIQTLRVCLSAKRVINNRALDNLKLLCSSDEHLSQAIVLVLEHGVDDKLLKEEKENG